MTSHIQKLKMSSLRRHQLSAPANGFGCTESFLFDNLQEALWKKIHNFRSQRDNFVCRAEATGVLEDSPFTIRQVWTRLLRYNYASEVGTSKETGSDCPTTLLWLKPHECSGRQFTVCCLILIAKRKSSFQKWENPAGLDSQSFYKKSLKQSENEAPSWRGQAEFVAKMFWINLESGIFVCLPLRELWPFFGQTIKR